MLRRHLLLGGTTLLTSFIMPLHSQNSSTWKDPSPHAVRSVSVGDGVRLEVLDWGGSGRAVVLLAGGGNTAHVFDNFAPKLTTHNHVYGITRRGFGASGYADAENVGERLGEDVLAVINALKLDKPILVGHSIAGAELSWMANRYPDRVAGVVYLEGGYSYAFDDGKGASALDMMKLQAPQPPPPGAADLVSFKALQRYDDRVNGFEFPEGELREKRQTNPDGTVGTWVESSADASVRADAKTYSNTLGAMTERQEKSVESGVLAAHVINIPNGSHFVFLSNEMECLHVVQAFLSKFS